MFLRQVRSKGHTYIQLVESFWDKEAKKSRQKVVMSFGNLDKLKKDESFIKALKRLIKIVGKD
jgi:hypothetical protein